MCFSVQIDRQLNKVANRFGAEVDRFSFEKFLEKQKLNPRIYKAPDQQNRIYPNYFAPVIIQDTHKKILRPMRYQLLPHFCSENRYTKINPKTGRKKEVPTYNARVDSLEKRKAWQSIFMKQHCLFPFVSFFEWVEHKGKKKQISFFPATREIMWAPGLYDRWTSKEEDQEIESFALITTTPAPEVENMGHDRCPIYLNEKHIDTWLNPQNTLAQNIYEILQQQEKTTYQYKWVP